MNAVIARDILARLSDRLQDCTNEEDPDDSVAVILDTALMEIDKLHYSMKVLAEMENLDTEQLQALEDVLR